MIGGDVGLSFFAKMNGGAALLCLLAGAASAQEDGVRQGMWSATSRMALCEQGSLTGRSCIGAIAERCMYVFEIVEGGGETERLDWVVAGPCYGEEAVHWQGRVDAIQLQLANATLPPEARGFDLREVSAAFEAYRDVVCEAENLAWPGMTGSGEVWIDCRMWVTAEHALRLENWMEALR